MSRRTTAGVVAAALMVAALLLVSLVPAPYVVYSPGPTFNLLGKEKGGELVRIGGDTKSYRDKGALRFLTVRPTGPDTKVFLPEALIAWVRKDQAVYRYSDIYRPTETADDVEARSQVDMVSSQDTAIAAALRRLGYSFGTSVQVLGVTRGGPGDGALEVRDTIRSVDGVRPTSVPAVVKAIQEVEPGTKVRLGLERSGKPVTVSVRTAKSDANPEQSALKITIGRGYKFPVDVHLRVSSDVGGPSAGMMFALAIYDELTPGSLTGGGDVAGTGTIDDRGQVGGIGGIQQKMAAAQRAGTQLFLAPAANCDEVRDGPDDPDKMRVAKVSTLKGALAVLDDWRADHDAKLPAC